MAYLMIHLNIANKILERCPGIYDRNAFLIGSVAPDAIGFQPGKRFAKAPAHFCIGNESWGYYTNYDEWLDNLIFNTEKLSDAVNKSFLFGYMSHIIADIENSKRFYTPIRLTDDKDYMQTWFNDCYEIDSILLDKIEDIDEFWGSLDNYNNYSMPGLVEADDIAYMIEKMKSEVYYSDRKPSLEYLTSIFTVQTVLNYIDDIADKTINIIEELKIKC